MVTRIVVGLIMGLPDAVRAVLLLAGTFIAVLFFGWCVLSSVAVPPDPSRVHAAEVRENPRLCAQTCREFGALHWQVNINTRECTCSGDVRTDPPER